MKINYVRTLVFVSLLFIALQGKSQLGTAAAVVTKPGATLGVNFAYSMPQGDFKEAYKFGVGGEVYGGVGWGKTFLIATVGYHSFTEKDGNIFGDKLTYIPIKAGVKQMFLMKKLFVQADAGMASIKVGGSSESKFAFDLGAGARLAGLEIGLFYDNFKVKESTWSSLNGKLGWSFTL